MAYNRRYNPDALPAHVEPEQAAQMLGRQSSQKTDYPSRTDSYSNRPPPAPPNPSGRVQQDERAGRSNSYRGESGANYDRYDRRQPQSPRTNSYGSGYDDGRPRHGSYASESRRYDSPPQGQGRPPPSQKPPSKEDSDRDSLWRLFKAVDKDRTSQLSEKELGSALVNGDYTAFDPHTVRMMIRMFDVDRSGTISFDEFCGLWGFLGEWRKLFDRFDLDRSGNISYDEFSGALSAFGYRLSPEYVQLLFNTYDFKGRGVLSFDLFVQSCISLKRMTDVFKKYDTDRDGYITLSFEQFLTGAQSLFLFNSISPETDRGTY